MGDAQEGREAVDALRARPARGTAERVAEIEMLRTDPGAYFDLPERGFEVTTDGETLLGWFRQVAAGVDPGELAREVIEAARDS